MTLNANINEFKVNEFLSLKLERNQTVIYVQNKRFLQCKYLIMDFSVKEETYIEDLDSIDEISDAVNSEFDYLLSPKPKISPETEFWGHCSNMQVWYENNYNTNILHSNLAFPLLKKLTDAGDPLARKVFAEEIGKRIDSGYLPVISYLIMNNYFSYLTPEQLDTLKFFKITPEFFEKISLGEVGKDELFNNFKDYLRENKPKTAKEVLSKTSLMKIFKDYDEIESVFRDGFELFPNNEELQVGYVAYLNGRGKHEKAIRYMEKLASIHPENFLYWSSLSLLNINQGRPHEALETLKKAHELKPEITNIQIQLAEAYHLTGDFVNRDEILYNLYNKQEDLGLEDKHELAIFSSAIGKYAYALPTLKNIIMKIPKDAETWLALANIYGNTNKKLHQKRCLKKIIHLNTQPSLKSDALNTLGVIYLDAFKFKKALEFFEQAIQLDPFNMILWTNQALAHVGILDMERTHKGLEIFEKIHEINEAHKIGDSILEERLEKELKELKKEFSDAKYECVFCQKEIEGRPETCPHCG